MKVESTKGCTIIKLDLKCPRCKRELILNKDSENFHHPERENYYCFSCKKIFSMDYLYGYPACSAHYEEQIEKGRCAYSIKGSCSISRANDMLLKQSEDEATKLKDLLRKALLVMSKSDLAYYENKGYLEVMKQIQEAVDEKR